MRFTLRRRDEPPVRRPIPSANAVVKPEPVATPVHEAAPKTTGTHPIRPAQTRERAAIDPIDDLSPTPASIPTLTTMAAHAPIPLARPNPSVISVDSLLEGRLRFAGPLHVDGSVEGSIEGPSVFIGASGRIDGGVQTEELRLDGQMQGEVWCESAALGPTARIDGHLVCTTLTLARGAVLEGRVSIGRDAKPPSSHKPAMAPPKALAAAPATSAATPRSVSPIRHRVADVEYLEPVTPPRGGEGDFVANPRLEQGSGHRSDPTDLAS